MVIREKIIGREVVIERKIVEVRVAKEIDRYSA